MCVCLCVCVYMYINILYAIVEMSLPHSSPPARTPILHTHTHTLHTHTRITRTRTNKWKGHTKKSKGGTPQRRTWHQRQKIKTISKKKKQKGHTSAPKLAPKALITSTHQHMSLQHVVVAVYLLIYYLQRPWSHQHTSTQHRGRFEKWLPGTMLCPIIYINAPLHI